LHLAGIQATHPDSPLAKAATLGTPPLHEEGRGAVRSRLGNAFFVEVAIAPSVSDLRANVIGVSCAK
jgi:hypothetical protein